MSLYVDVPIDEETKIAFKIYCVKNKTTMADMVASMIQEKISGNHGNNAIGGSAGYIPLGTGDSGNS